MDYEVHFYGKDGQLSHIRALSAADEADAKARMAEVPHAYGKELRRVGELIHRIDPQRPT